MEPGERGWKPVGVELVGGCRYALNLLKFDLYIVKNAERPGNLIHPEGGGGLNHHPWAAESIGAPHLVLGKTFQWRRVQTTYRPSIARDLGRVSIPCEHILQYVQIDQGIMQLTLGQNGR